MADTVPRVLEVVVRFVVDPTFAAAGEVTAKVRARDVEQRANDAAAPRMNARKASEPGAANQLQEERLRLIILRVADRDAVGAQRVGRLLHKVVSDPAGRIFDREVSDMRVAFDVLDVHNDSQSDTSRQVAAERLVAVRGRPEAMVQVGEPCEGEIAVFGQFAEQKEKGDGVGAAGQPNQHTRAGRAEPVALNRAAHALVERAGQIPTPLGFSGMPEGRLELPTPRL